MIVGKRQGASVPREGVRQVGAAAPRNLVGSAAERHPESRHLGSSEQLQRHPAGDLTTESELCHVVVDGLGIPDVAVAAESVQHADRVVSRQSVVVTGAQDRIVRVYIPRFDKTQQPVGSRNCH